MKAIKVMPFSAKLGTPLSNFEAGENYKDVDDPSLTVAFPVGRGARDSIFWPGRRLLGRWFPTWP